jgi:hypothetical protein
MQPNAWKNFKFLLCCRVPPRPRTSSAKDIDPNSGFLAEKNNNFFARDKFISQADYDHHFIVNQINQNPFGTFANSVHSFFYPSNSLHSEPRDSSMIEFTPSFERAMGGAGGGGGLSRQNTNTGGTFSRKNTDNSKLQRTTTNTTTATSIMNKGGTSPNVNKNNSKNMKNSKPANDAINYVENPIRSNSPQPPNITNNDNISNNNTNNNNNTADTTPRTLEAESRPEADSISSAYDFFDEDFRNVGGAYSNSFAQRRSSWGMRGESLGSEITSEVGSRHSTLHTASMTRTTRSVQELPDMESTYDHSDAESRA